MWLDCVVVVCVGVFACSFVCLLCGCVFACVCGCVYVCLFVYVRVCLADCVLVSCVCVFVLFVCLCVCMFIGLLV